MNRNEETKRKVLTAFLWHLEAGSSSLGDITTKTGVPDAVAKKFLEDFGMQVHRDGQIMWTNGHKQNVEAYLHLDPEEPAAATTTINNHGTAQIQTGPGVQNMNITYGQALVALQTEIEKSDAIPEDEKKGVLAKLDTISRHPVVNTILQQAMRIISGSGL